MGFVPVRENIPTLSRLLKNSGYITGIIGKTWHYEPVKSFAWDTFIEYKELGCGRSPELYGSCSKDFFQKAKESSKPFFLHLNSHDPHRPFSGSRQEKDRALKKNEVYPGPNRLIKEWEIEVPGFLPDIPDVRKEVAQYYTSVNRLDAVVGQVLKELEQSGLEKDTMVLFLSDHGMAFPFAKTNCYLNSTKTPLIIRWPRRIKPGIVNSDHLIAGVDIMPMLLEAAGLKIIDGLDGQSFLPLLLNEPYTGRNLVFSMFYETYAKNQYQMRCLQTKKFAYIYNGWSDGKTVFKNESQSGLSMKAMKLAAENDPEIAERVKLFLYRVPQEFYDLEKDPCALKNLIDIPEYQKQIRDMKAGLADIMAKTGDPVTETFKKQMMN
jgi:N-sulfoglucosamine sulfohydrolase